MDSRGYGRRAEIPMARRRVMSVVLLGAVVALSAGAYAVLDPSTIPVTVGVPTVVGGLAAAAYGLWLAGRWTPRTRYRPDRWRLAETVAASCGVLPAVVLILLGRTDAGLLYPSVDPLTWPTLSLPLLAAIAVVALPAVLTPKAAS